MPTKKTAVKRLTDLRDLMKTVPSKNYNHECYISDVNEFTGKPHECGTVACTLGHAVVNRHLFKGLKLRPVLDDDGKTIVDIEPTDGADKFYGGWAQIGDVADEYFGEGVHEFIMDAEAYESLGLYDNDVQPKHVVARIEYFVNHTYGVKI